MRPLAPLSLALVLGLSLVSSAEAERPAYTMDDGVRLSPEMRSTLQSIARRYHQRTGQRIHITSGTRSPNQQARAMYDKLVRGQRLTRLYRDFEAASAIQQAYRSHRRQGRGQCVAAMSEVIRQQVRRGCYISRHLVASAADVRSRNMTRRQRRIFRQVVREVGGVMLLDEGTPPHWHLQLE